MKNEQFVEFLRGLRIHWDDGDLLSLTMLFFCGVLYIGRKLRHEFLLPTFCRKCGSSVKVYFMRTTRAITNDETCDNEELSDWLVCKNDDCREATPIPEEERP